MLAHALGEVNGTTVQSLETYVRGVERQRVRYTDLLRRLTSAWEGQVGVSHTRLADTHERLYADPSSTALTAGGFADPTGIDFFGFRELGIDVGNTLSVPLHLLQGVRPGTTTTSTSTSTLDPLGPNGTTADATVSPSSGMAFLPPRPYVLLSKDAVSEQIGLLRPLYHAHIKSGPTYQDRPLPDDDPMIGTDSKSKVGLSGRVPPTGRLPNLVLASQGPLRSYHQGNSSSSSNTKNSERPRPRPTKPKASS